MVFAQVFLQKLAASYLLVFKQAIERKKNARPEFSCRLCRKCTMSDPHSRWWELTFTMKIL